MSRLGRDSIVGFLKTMGPPNFRPHPRQAEFMAEGAKIRILPADWMPADRFMVVSEPSQKDRDEIARRIAAGEDSIKATADVLAERGRVVIAKDVGP